MSVFEGKTETKEPTEVTEPENYLEELVGEGKKFKDAESLARGKFESDRHIQNLERQLAELREDLSKDDKVSELLELVRSQKDQATQKSPNSGTENEPGDGGNPNKTSSDLTAEQLEALIESHVSKRETTAQRQDNLSQVDNVLEEVYGEKAGQFLKDKGRELGMSLKEMEDIAARNPRAFFQLVGVNRGAPKNQSTVVGGGRSSEAGAGNRKEGRNFAYYQKMRREDKRKYYASATQHQMYMDAKEMGPAFYED